MKKMMLVVTLASLAACTAAAPAVSDDGKETYIDPGHIEIRTGIPEVNVYKFVDKEDNVLCYVMDGYSSGNIHCMPYNDEGTHLDVMEEVPERQYGD